MNIGFRVATAPPIVVKYSDLVEGKNLNSTIEQAYGPKGASSRM